jgi:CHAD domain-containing protein
MKLRLNKPARQNATRLLPRLATEFLSAMDRAIDGEIDDEEAHRLRILAKRFRYSMEYFRPCYGETMDGYINDIGNLQRAMGKMTDAGSTRELLRDLLPARSERGCKKLLEALRKQEAEMLAAVGALWREQFGKSLTRKRFLRYLGRPPAPRPAPPVAEIGGSLGPLPAHPPRQQHYH